MNLTKILFTFAVLIVLISCRTNYQTPKELNSLKNAYGQNFLIGVALDTNQIKETETAVTSLITKEFNSITAENCMKSMFIHPDEDKFDFKMTDKFVAFGKKNNMHIHGHTLVWHSQLSPWLKQIKDSISMANALTKHISTIVGKYRGSINSWDVVNEALNEDGTLRKSVFLDTYGQHYLTLAFQLAAKADPKADLYYNDYNLCQSAKRKGAISLIKTIQNKGVKIDGVGEQGHWNLTSPSIEEIEQTILDFAALGLKVSFTELDITVLPNPWDIVGADVNQKAEASEKMNPYPNELPETVQLELAARYEAIFKLFIKHQDKIDRVTFWGVNDSQSWLNDWPIKGRTNYPLLFDTALKQKKAYYKVLDLKNAQK